MSMLETSTPIEVTAPLAGIRVAVTHARDQAKEQSRLLQMQGGDVYYYPAIEIVPFDRSDELDSALRSAAEGGYDWLVLNDADTILVVAERIRALEIDPTHLSQKIKIAAIGCMTAQWTSELLGIQSDFAPEVYTPELVVAQLELREGDRVLLPQSSMTRANLARHILDTGAKVDAINAYRTLIGRGGDAVPDMLWEGQLDAIIFTFPTAVRYFARRLKAEGGSLAMLDNVTIACIGPMTAAAVYDYSLHVDIIPDDHTIEGLVRDLASHFSA